jgi:hypothetical protein
MQIIQSIQNRIYEVRGERVMLDFDLSDLYEVEARVLNQAVKGNSDRFPEDFMFQLNPIEWNLVLSQINQNQLVINPSSQSVMTRIPKNRGGIYLPYAFTEQGVAMLSGVLRSERAVKMNISIMRAFVAVRKTLLMQHDIREQLKQIQEHITEHDMQLDQIYKSA